MMPNGLLNVRKEKNKESWEIKSFREKVHNVKQLALSSEVFRGSTISLGLKLLGMLFSYIILYLLSENLGAEAVGFYTIAQVLLSILGIFVLLGMNTSVVKYAGINLASDQGWAIIAIHKRMFVIVLFMSCVVGLCVFYNSSNIAIFVFQDTRLAGPIMLVAFVLPFYALCILNAETMRGLQRVISYNVLSHTGIMGCSVIVLLGFFILSGDPGVYKKQDSLSVNNIELLGVIALAISYVLFSFVSIGTVKKCFSKISTRKRIGGVPSINNILSLSFPMLLASSCYLLNSQADKVMIGMLRTTGELGVYNVALRVAMAASIGLAAVNTIVAPKIAGLYSQGHIIELEHLLVKSARAMLLVASPFLLVCLCIPEVLLGFFGEEFTEGNIVLVLLIIGQVANLACGSVGVFLNMTGHQVVFRNILLLSLLINIVLNYSLTPVYGIDGAALATVVSLVFWNGVSAFYCKKTLNVRTFYFPFMKL